MTVRLPHLERGLTQALTGVAGVVTWSRGHNPRDSATLLAMRLMAPPQGIKRHGGHVRARAQSATVTVDAATADVRSILGIDGYRHVYDVQAGDTIEDVRDAHLTQLQSIEAGRMTATAVSTDQIDLTPADFTALWQITTDGEMSVSVTHGGALRVDQRQELAHVELQAFARGEHLQDHAHAILTSALRRLVEHDRLVALAEWGVAVTDWTPPVDISAVAGAGWETRASSVVTVNLRSTYVETVKRLETVVEDFVLENAS